MSRSKVSRRAALVAALLACLPPAASPQEAPDPADAWRTLKASWTSAHLALAADLLAEGEIGFADTQAGLALQMSGEAPPDALAAYRVQREEARPAAGWSRARRGEYVRRRATLHGDEAAQAARLLTGETPRELAAEIEAWVLRLDPDCAAVRERRGEARVEALGCWLPAGAAVEMNAGKVRFQGAWERPDPAKSASWQTAYEIPCEHFVLKTTVPYAQAVEAARETEALWRLWTEMLEGIRDAGRVPLPQGWEAVYADPPVVWILRDETEYRECYRNVCARPNSPKPSLGFTEGERRAYFHQEVIHGENPRTTRLHECTHLMHYTLVLPAGANNQCGWWAIEGAARTIESLENGPEIDWDTASGPPRPGLVQDLRKVQGAISPALIDLTAQEFYAGDPDGLWERYAQSHALAHFLLYGEGGRHREAFLRYVLAAIPNDLPREGYDRHFPGFDRATLASKAGGHLQTLLSGGSGDGDSSRRRAPREGGARQPRPRR